MYIANPIGRRGEDLAVAFLLKKGYKILERNYRKKYTEVDIIAIEFGKDSIQARTSVTKMANTLVFIEVKTRTSNLFGTPLEAITPWKLQLLIRSAYYYKNTHKNQPEALRIDAIVIMITKNGEVSKIEHIQNITE